MGVLEDGLGHRPWNLSLWQFLVASACRLRKRPFVLLDVGANRALNPMTRWLNTATTNLAAHVSYRDQESADAMRESGSKADAMVVPDVAFTHPSPTSAEPEPGLVVVGAMAYYGHADDPVQGAGVRRQYVATLAGALGRILDTGCRVELVGGDGVDIAIADDVRAAVLAARPDTREDTVVVRACTRFGELTELMSRAEVVVGSRFHNIVCALRLARPTVSIGYAGKCHHLMQQIGLADYHQDIEQLDADLLVDQVARARRDGTEIDRPDPAGHGRISRPGAGPSSTRSRADRCASTRRPRPPTSSTRWSHGREPSRPARRAEVAAGRRAGRRAGARGRPDHLGVSSPAARAATSTPRRRRTRPTTPRPTPVARRCDSTARSRARPSLRPARSR